MYTGYGIKIKFQTPRSVDFFRQIQQMEWNTIAFELLERILISTASPKDLMNACRTCKTWYEVSSDQPLWKAMYYEISVAPANGTSNVDWKKKVLDQVLVRENLKHGRCVVHTLATTQGLRSRTTLELYNMSLYKDYFLGCWLEMQNYGSYGGVSRLNSHVINMATEQYTEVKDTDLVLLNHYIAKSTSSYYSGADYRDIRVQHFNPKSPTFSAMSAVRLPLVGETYRTLIENHCPDSNYIAFNEQSYNSTPKLIVINAESNKIVHTITEQSNEPWTDRTKLYDHYLAVRPIKSRLEVIDLITNKKITRDFTNSFFLGFMTADTIAIYIRDDKRKPSKSKILLWNFKDEKDKIFPAGDVPCLSITMIYNGMWVVCDSATLSFFDMNTGSSVNRLSLRDSNTTTLSILSDGRIGVAQPTGCRVISFIDSEVNRKIKLDVIDASGGKTIHEISAHELPTLFVEQVKKPLEMMISRIVPYRGATKAKDERFVMIFSQDEKNKSQPVNDIATKLLGTAVKPTNLNTPYQGWICDGLAIVHKDHIVDRACGTVIIAREKKIDGRWQLVSLDSD